MDKKIDWAGTALMVAILLIMINGLIYVLSLIFPDDIGVGQAHGFDIYVWASFLFVLGGYRGGNVLMYEGWFSDDDYEDVLPNKTITRLIDAILIGMLIVVFIS